MSAASRRSLAGRTPWLKRKDAGTLSAVSPSKGSNKQEFQQNGRILWKNRFLKRTEFMKKRVKLIVLLIELLIRQAKEYEKKDEEK